MVSLHLQTRRLLLLHLQLQLNGRMLLQPQLQLNRRGYCSLAIKESLFLIMNLSVSKSFNMSYLFLFWLFLAHIVYIVLMCHLRTNKQPHASSSWEFARIICSNFILYFSFELWIKELININKIVRNCVLLVVLTLFKVHFLFICFM